MAVAQRTLLRDHSYSIPLDPKHDAADVGLTCHYVLQLTNNLHDAMSKMITTISSWGIWPHLGLNRARCYNTPSLTILFFFKSCSRSPTGSYIYHTLHFLQSRSFMYRPAVSVLAFDVAFTQSNCSAKNSSLITFNLRNLVPLNCAEVVVLVQWPFYPLCWSEIEMIAALVPWSRMLHRKTLQLTRYNFVAYWGKITNIWNTSALFARSWWKDNSTGWLIKST